MFAKLSDTWALMGASWNVLKRDTRLLVFPLLSPSSPASPASPSACMLLIQRYSQRRCRMALAGSR
jgi:hypothetical protein